jgi:hypothetical protein
MSRRWRFHNFHWYFRPLWMLDAAAWNRRALYESQRLAPLARVAHATAQRRHPLLQPRPLRCSWHR